MADYAAPTCDCPAGSCPSGGSTCYLLLPGAIEALFCEVCVSEVNGQTLHQDGVCLRCNPPK